MILNLSNHPRLNWPEKQLFRAVPAAVFLVQQYTTAKETAPPFFFIGERSEHP